MKNKIINDLKSKGFEFIKFIPSKNCIVLAMDACYHEDDETYYDSIVGCEITRPHYFGKRVDIVGNKNDAIATIYKHEDQQETLIKKFHFHLSEPDKRYKQKIRMLVNHYKNIE